MASLSQWVQGARPRTLPAALAPVAAGTGAAAWQLETLHGDVDWALVAPRALLALGGSFCLQIDVNYANDYSVGIRGTDDDREEAFRSLALGGLCGLALVALAQIWWTLVIGAAAIAAAWFYTGGKRPYGYLGLGELFVFVFFGLVAVNGTAYALSGAVGWVALLASIAIGLLAVALMLTNNLRDIPTDALSGKRTLAVRLGERGTRRMYTVAVLAPFALMVPVMVAQWPVVIVLPALLLALPPVRAVLAGAAGRDLIPVLGATGRLELVYSLLLLSGLLL